MKRLFTTTILTAAAASFLVATPAVKKTQNSAQPAGQAATAKPKVHKKHVKKVKKNAAPAAQAKQ